MPRKRTSAFLAQIRAGTLLLPRAINGAQKYLFDQVAYSYARESLFAVDSLVHFTALAFKAVQKKTKVNVRKSSVDNYHLFDEYALGLLQTGPNKCAWRFPWTLGYSTPWTV
uniref:Glycosyl transferase n=1 Tax=Steinernema glaseri TaxID=37863 RepID=A0A1I8AAE1_9BILA